MLLSMTGQGQGRRAFDQTEIAVEVRAVNNRFLKLQIKLSDGLSGLEAQIENTVRQSLKRGSLQLSVHLHGGGYAGDYKIQENVVEAYFLQCQQIAKRLGISGEVSLDKLLGLPGVTADATSSEITEDLSNAILEVVGEALECLNRMRAAEGASMAEELKQQLSLLSDVTGKIVERAPGVIDEYRQRLHTRLSTVLSETGGQVQDADLLREVTLLADKADIREEVVRLNSHFVQFEKLLDDRESQGRKLDFLIQEMFREVNTIGSKAGDAVIAQRVVDLKAVIEQMRELVQNVE